MAFNSDYSPYWKDLGSVLVYQSNGFQFNPYVIITEFEDCLIKKITPSKLYHAIDPKPIIPYNTEFLKKVGRESSDKAVVIISNVLGNGKLVLDALKTKIEMFTECYKIPILCLFALKNNRLAKPHTGMWTFLNAYYKRSGNTTLQKAIVVSDKGGRLIEKELKNGSVKLLTDSTDIDRAFAYNINIPYYTIDEYTTEEKKEKFSWNSNCLAPEIRYPYVEKLAEYQNPNIFASLKELGIADKYIIVVYGAPRAGKTTLCKELLKKWRSSNWGKTHAVKRFGRDKYTIGKRISHARKAIADNISAIIDGDAHTALLRKPFEEISAAYNAPILYVEVNPGLGMAHIFNHVAVETSQDENLELYDVKEYHFYKSKVTRPNNVLLYCPVIQKTKQVMDFRY